MTYSSTLELHGLQMGFLEGRRLVVTYVYPGTIEVEGVGGVRYSPGKDETVVELGRFDHADGAWFDDSRWSWNDATANPSARVWVQNVLAAHEAKKSRSYTRGGELVLVWSELPTRRSEEALLAAGFQPSLATWRAATSERRRALVHALLANEATPVVSLPREATDERKELKERAQHAWMRWFAIFRDTLVGRTFRLKGTPALRDHELIVNYRHSSGASLQVRLGVSRHPLLYPVTVDGAVTLKRDLVAWEDFPALEGEIGAVLDARKKAQRTSSPRTTGAAKKASGRAKKPAEPVPSRELAALPPALPTPPTWTDRLVDAFNADAGPQLAFSRRRGQDTFVFVVHAEERPDHRLAVVDTQDEQLDDVRWLDDSLTPAQQDAITARIERALARLDPDTEHATSLTRTALEKFKARAIALGADPERPAASEEYRWLAEALRDLAAPRGTDLEELASWLSTRSLRGAGQLLREWTGEAPLENLFHDLWDNLEDNIVLSVVDEQDRRGFFVPPQTIAETDSGPALVLREMDADNRPRVVPVRLREDCEDDRCLVESDELHGGERAWHLGIEWDLAFIRDLYKKVREFEHNVWTAPEQLAEVREMLFWAAAMIDTPRCRGESRRVAEAAFRDAKNHYDRARTLITQGDSPAGIAAMNAALRKIAEAAGELAQSCAEGQTTLVGTPGDLHGQLRAEMRASRLSKSPPREPVVRRARRRVTANAKPPVPPRRRKDPGAYEEREFYLYHGYALCEACGEAVRRELQARGLGPIPPGRDDSDSYPQGPYTSSEADAPAHCGRGRGCLDPVEIDTPHGVERLGAFLGNPLTSAGEEYVREQVAMERPVALQVWGPFYDLPGVTREHVQRAMATLPPGGKEALQQWAASGEPTTALLDFVDEHIRDGVIKTRGPEAVLEVLRLLAREDRLPLAPGGDAIAEDRAVLAAFHVPGFDAELLPHLPMGFALDLFAAGTRARVASFDVIDRDTIDVHWYDSSIAYEARRAIEADLEQALEKALARGLTHAFEREHTARRRKPTRAQSLRPRRIVTSSASLPAPRPRQETHQPARKTDGQPWWRVAPTIPRHEETEALHAEAAAILAGVRAYLSDPDWSTLDDDERTEIIRDSVVPLWEEDDAERLTQAVADVDGNLRDEDSIVEEIAAALRDSTDPELEIHTVTPDEACAFVRDHHRHLPECNRRGIVHALAARWRGQIAAVAVAGAPTGRWGRASDCPPEGTLEITRVASIAGLRRYDRRGRLVPVGAASALVARLVDLLPQSGRGLPGCRLVTYQLTSEDGAIYRALVAKGLRPVARSSHQQAGGARSRVALAGAKIRWEAGPAAGPPDWALLQPQHRPGAQAAFGAFERIHQREAA